MIKYKYLCFCLFVFGLLGKYEIYAEENPVADSLYALAKNQMGKVSLEKSLDAFEAVLDEDRDYAPAYHQMAWLYMTVNSPDYRLRAKRAIQKAIRLDRENIDYQMTYGHLLWQQGFWQNAEDQFKKVLELAPDQAEAAYMIGLHGVKNFLKYNEMEFRDVIHHSRENSYNLIKYDGATRKLIKKAIRYFSLCINLVPEYSNAYYQLGLIHYESGQPNKLIETCERLLTIKPEDKNALLFSGLGYQAVGNENEAYQFYTRALNEMGTEERALMESVNLLVKDERDIEEKSLKITLNDSSRIGTKNNVELDRFWKQQDPLFLTKFNERRMEHYGRIAYANLRFSRPERNIDGWQTDMGEAYIKYGRFIERKTKRGDFAFDVPLDVGLRPSDDPGSNITLADRLMGNPEKGISIRGALTSANAQVETWFYEGFKIEFVVMDGFHGALISSTPDEAHYRDPYQTRKYLFPHQVVAFRDQDSIRLEFAYALPRHKLRLSKDELQVTFEDGIFIFDADWQDVFREPVEPVILTLPKLSSPKTLWDDYLLSYRNVHVAPGTYQVVVETKSENTGDIGTFRETRSFTFSDSTLTMSDLFVARQIQEKVPFPDGRKDLHIIPNPLRTFKTTDLVQIYFEIYNLSLDTFGETDFEIAYHISAPEKEEIDPSFFMALDDPMTHAEVQIDAAVKGPMRQDIRNDDLPDSLVTSLPQLDYRVRYILPRMAQDDEIEQLTREIETTATEVSAQYKGRQSDDFTFLKIDIGSLNEGVHKLIVTVKDKIGGATIKKEAFFRVVHDLATLGPDSRK